MASSLSKYALINAKLRARISQILPADMFTQMAHAPSIDAALALLRGTAFASLEGTYAKTGDLRVAELELLKDVRSMSSSSWSSGPRRASTRITTSRSTGRRRRY